MRRGLGGLLYFISLLLPGPCCFGFPPLFPFVTIPLFPLYSSPPFTHSILICLSMLLLQLPSLLFLFSASTAPFLSSHFPVILFLSPFLYYSNSFSLIFSFIPCFPLFQLQFTTFPILVFLSYCPSFSSSFPILVFLSYRPSLSSLLLLLLLIPS